MSDSCRNVEVGGTEWCFQQRADGRVDPTWLQPDTILDMFEALAQSLEDIERKVAHLEVIDMNYKAGYVDGKMAAKADDPPFTETDASQCRNAAIQLREFRGDPNCWTDLDRVADKIEKALRETGG